MTRTISQYFEQDHDRLDGLFKAFQTLKQDNFLKAREAFAAFKEGLQRHIVWEENVLFPLFEQKTGVLQGPTEIMRQEHTEIKKYLEQIFEKAEAGISDTNTEESLLLSVLSVHNVKEENVLYPAIDRIATQEDVQRVFEQIQQISEERQQAIHT